MRVGSVAEGLIAMQDCPSEKTPKPGWTAADLAAAGVKLSAPCGVVGIRNGWAIVGTIIWMAHMVEVIPRCDLNAQQYARLLATAAQVWLHGLDGAQGWKWSPRLGWVVGVATRYSLESARRSSSSMCSSDSGTALVSAGSREPSGR